MEASKEEWVNSQNYLDEGSKLFNHSIVSMVFVVNPLFLVRPPYNLDQSLTIHDLPNTLTSPLTTVTRVGVRGVNVKTVNIFNDRITKQLIT